MLDSGRVLDFNGIRKGTYVDVLFLSNVDKIILSKFNGVQYQAHAFASNVVGDTRPWDEDHLSGTKTKWDLLYDPGSYGYCYGITFYHYHRLHGTNQKEKNQTQMTMILN